MIVMVDAGLYSYQSLRGHRCRADTLFREGANVRLPVPEWLPDSSYWSFIADPDAKRQNSYMLRKGLAEIINLPGIHVRAVDYEIPDHGDGGELITLVTTITDPGDVSAAGMAACARRKLCHLTRPGRIRGSGR